MQDRSQLAPQSPCFDLDDDFFTGLAGERGSHDATAGDGTMQRCGESRDLFRQQQLRQAIQTNEQIIELIQSWLQSGNVELEG